MRSLANIDLNLLRMLRVLLETRSVTRSGEKLGLSQPAASRVVAKLRYTFNDPLLVRTGKGYMLTPVANELRTKVLAAIAAAEQVFLPATFDPLTTQREFRIATTDYGSLTVIVPFAPYLLQNAPQAIMTVSGWSDETFQDLEYGDLDVALYADGTVPPHYHYDELFVEAYAIMMRTGHPLSHTRTPDSESLLEGLACFPNIVARYPNGQAYVADDVLERLGAPPHRNSIAIPYFTTAPLIVAETDAVMLLPKRVADRFAAMLPLIVLPIRTNSEAFSYRVIWHRRTQNDAGIRWLRDSLARVLQ